MSIKMLHGVWQLLSWFKKYMYGLSYKSSKNVIPFGLLLLIYDNRNELTYRYRSIHSLINMVQHSVYLPVFTEVSWFSGAMPLKFKSDLCHP